MPNKPTPFQPALLSAHVALAPSHLSAQAWHTQVSGCSSPPDKPLPVLPVSQFQLGSSEGELSHHHTHPLTTLTCVHPTCAKEFTSRLLRCAQKKKTQPSRKNCGISIIFRTFSHKTGQPFETLQRKLIHDPATQNFWQLRAVQTRQTSPINPILPAMNPHQKNKIDVSVSTPSYLPHQMLPSSRRGQITHNPGEVLPPPPSTIPPPTYSLHRSES